MMSLSRTLSALAAVALLAAALFSAPAARADEVADAQALVNHLMGDAIATFGGKSLPMAERGRQLRRMITQYADVDLAAKDILGRYWAKATPAQQAEFRGLVVDYAVGSWSRQLSDLPTNQQVEFTTSETTPSGRLLLHSLMHSNDVTPVDWSIAHAADGHLVIADVAISGVSIVHTMRADFGTIIRANGGQLPPLFQALRTKIASYGTAGQN
ncbi:toluene tolerance, Ttg2 [mine drainage metagenome]|uniref:Toluene tolerance, Ttg2 n=1 Tax=mine drainage metagenome TaxID=410659 RepID=A0A1J5RRY6_9ZZZZ